MNLRATSATASLVFASTLIAATHSTNVLADSVADWPVPTNKAAKQNPVPATHESISTGEGIYSDSCGNCHGPNLLVPTGAPELTSATLETQTDGELFWKIRRGRDEMPGFRGHLSARQTWHVINYIRSQ